MAWVNTVIDTTAMDEGTDDASQARAEIKQMADNLNVIKDARGANDGVASLDVSGKLPAAQLPTVAAAKGGTGQTLYSVGDILYASATGTLSKLAAGTLGYVLKSNGPGNAPTWQQEGGGLVAGTRMLFQNSAAPTGWTKEVNSAYNNVAMRIVTGAVGSGGDEDFSAVFNSSKTTEDYALVGADVPTIATGAVGGNSGYQSFLVASINAASGHKHSMLMDIKYRDFILAQKA